MQDVVLVRIFIEIIELDEISILAADVIEIDIIDLYNN